MIESLSERLSMVQPTILKVLLTSRWLWLILLTGQFALVQALTGVQYGDASRNLHWGMLTAENPGFLLGAADPYGRTKGFVPDPPELAPLGLAETDERQFHSWWGPLPVLLLALVWKLTGARELLALVVPLAAGGTVLACYALGSWLLDRRDGMLAAAFLALFPLFYQHAVISYSEAISALFLLLVLWAYLRGQIVLTVVLGTLTLLCKMDMLVVYGGVVGCSLLYRLRYEPEPRDVAHSVLALLLPGLALMAWLWLRTGSPLPTGSGRGVSVAIFQLLALDMLQRLFFIPWYGAILTLAVLGGCIARGLRSPRLTADQRVVLGAWIGWGLLVLLVYMATPGASNSPRVLIPSLPAVALLVVEGWRQLPRQWGRRVGLYVGALFLVTSLFVVYFQFTYAPYMRAHAGLWGWLREQPQGFVLTANPWLTLWKTGQPVVWFEGDTAFQANILHNRTNFARYVTQNPIQYVPVPRAELVPAMAASPIKFPVNGMYGDEVLIYLREHARQVAVPPYYDVYVLDER